MIETRGLTKHYGDVRAVQDLNFTVKPGLVTGFLGPNGAGKATTMRMILGLDHPTAGEATVAGHRYRARIASRDSSSSARKSSGSTAEPTSSETASCPTSLTT